MNVPGREVSIHHGLVSERRRSWRILAVFVAALALVGIGIAIGNRTAAPRRAAQPSAVTTSLSVTRTTPRPPRPGRVPPAPTRASAVAAAARSITAFDGDVLLQPAHLRAVIARIASAASRAQLTAAFAEASAQTRAKLGAGTVPTPVIVLRSVPIGYRIERFSTSSATVAVWYVGIVGSGATVQPQQSWRTQVVSLVWEDRSWKVSAFRSSAGPTPPLSTAEVAGSASDLFAAIPRFEEFTRAEP